MTLQTPPIKPTSPTLPHTKGSDLKSDQSLDTAAVAAEESGRERLKHHRVAVAGQFWIPERWGKEELLKDWIDGSAFEASLHPSGVVSARLALAREAKRSLPNDNSTSAATAGALTILNSW